MKFLRLSWHYHGRQTLCWMFASSLPWTAEWNVLQLFSWRLCAAAAASLFPSDCCASSLCRQRDLLVLLCFVTLDLTVFLSSGPHSMANNLCASSRVATLSRPLSMVLDTSCGPSERQSLVESCDSIQRSLPVKLSAISKYWLTFAKQPRKPNW